MSLFFLLSQVPFRNQFSLPSKLLHCLSLTHLLLRLVARGFFFYIKSYDQRLLTTQCHNRSTELKLSVQTKHVKTQRDKLQENHRHCHQAERKYKVSPQDIHKLRSPLTTSSCRNICSLTNFRKNRIYRSYWWPHFVSLMNETGSSL